ncbi:MAG: hypothetical protein COV66_00805 [Nitrospinae bacterium CG11_big_fil_rev_8_21_14_0_20_45_15]|nr:MAG: hypothetical protein COV66_00805 [Nitrospinae bacterium CG11_big_fil_rev_8_21_14_0_20_45_15]
MDLGGCAGGMVGTVLNNAPYNHAETLSHITSLGAGRSAFKDPKYGISFSFSSDWKVVEPTEKLKISEESDLRIFLQGPNGFVMARVDQWNMSLSKVDYEEGFDEFFGEVLASRIRKYDHLNMKGSTVIKNKVTPSEIGLTFEIATTYTKSKKGPLLTIGKHFLPFENDFVVNLVAVGSPSYKNIKEDALWKISETFQISELSVIQ